MEDEKKEKRSYRFAAFLEVDLYVPKSILSVGKGYVTDMSTSGLGFRSKEEFQKGAALLIDFTLDSGEILEVSTKIARAEKIEFGYDYGVMYENNTEIVLRSIEEFIENKLKTE